MMHLDIKKLGRFVRTGHRITGDRAGQSNTRGVGWEYLHVCIDDASRIAYTDLLPNQKAHSAIAHLKAALAYYRRLGVTVKRVMTDNGPCYTSHAFAATCKQFGLKHIRTKPYTPRTNLPAAGRRQGRTLHPCLQQAGKPPGANGPTCLQQAGARAYQTSTQRAKDLPLWPHSYHWHQPHSGIKQQTPVGHLNLNQNNLLRLHSAARAERRGEVGCPLVAADDLLQPNQRCVLASRPDQRAGCRQAQHRRLPRLLLGCLTVLGDRLSAGAVGDLGPKGRGPRREPIDTPDTPVDRALGSGQGRRYGCERQN